MTEDKIKNIALIASVAYFTILTANYGYAQDSISSKLELKIVAYNIARNNSGEAISPSIKFWVHNVSNEKVVFPFDKSMIWFWEKSIDGKPFEAMSSFNLDASLLQEKATLVPGEAVKGYISGSSYVSGPVTRIRLRYNRQPYYMLVSNELDLSSQKWGDKTHTDDLDWLNEKLILSIYNDEGSLKAVIKNISKEKISFYFETCPICFWSVSINGGEWKPLSDDMHARACPLRNILILMPDESITYDLHKYIQPDHINTLKLRYRYGEYDEKHMVLESEWKTKN